MCGFVIAAGGVEPFVETARVVWRRLQPVAAISTTPHTRDRSFTRPRFFGKAVYPWGMSIVGIVLLVAAIALLVAAEWPRFARRVPGASRPKRRHLRVVQPESDPDEFQRAVERDLANLPTYDPRAKREKS
jgi:hypothetical protein